MKNYIDVFDKEYPNSLRCIKNPPNRLYYRGNIDLLKNLCF